MPDFNAAVYLLRSPLHDADRGQKVFSELLGSLQKAFSCRETNDLTGDDFDFLFIIVLTGGTENLFREIWPDINRSKKPFALVATETDNSLPAAVEILAWLNATEATSQAEIIHGAPEQIVGKAKEKVDLHKISHVLRHQKAGIVGEPSEWLIASMPDRSKIENKLGLQLVPFSMEELKKNMDKGEASALSGFSQSFYRACDKQALSELARAAKIYAGLIRLVRTHHLSALTLRCFDILSSEQTTGCLALAKLNDEGITSACEGDVPAMLSMMLLRAIAGGASFMANPSRITDKSVTFAHCTCPPGILRQYSLKTHFESGKGLAISGEFATGVFTVCRFDFVNNRYALATGKSVVYAFSSSLCRTQITLEIQDAADYFLSRPLGNHHILIPGDFSDKIRKWCRLQQMQPVWQ